MQIENGIANLGRLEDLSTETLRELARQLHEQGATRVLIEVEDRDDRSLATLERLGFRSVARVLGVDLDVFERDLDRTPRGASFGSVHVQTDDLPAVVRTVQRFVPLLPGKSKGSVVIPPRNGWIAVHDELCDRDPSALPRLARELSDALGVVVIQIGVEEGAVARYRISERGRMLDEYLSVPEYYGPLPSGEVVALAANPTLVERLTGGDRRAVREAAIQSESLDGVPPPVETLRALASAIGIEGADLDYPQAREVPGAIAIDR
jgi:hypothetical protein